MKLRELAKGTHAGQRAAGKRAAAAVRIRMYNVGFGDAFLVTVPTADGDKRLLFDCGSIAAGPHSIAEVAGQIIADCTEGERARIDVVVCTHRHRDHVSGFASPGWDEVQVSEVWMPWTEDPDDATARRILRKQAGLAASLASSAALAASGLTALAMNVDTPVPENLPVAAELTLNALSNESAMTTLHSGFTGEPLRRFLPAVGDDGERVRTFTTPVLPGVRIHVLGPSRDEDVITDMDPPKGESYLRMRDQLGRAGSSGCRPVGEEFEMPGYGPGNIPEPYQRYFVPSDFADVGMQSPIDELAAAVALDKAVNGTSLMLVLEVRGKCLLFPGDAQWGTWNAAMQDSEWRALLSRTAFYKIGHHGSHNATPKDFVEQDIGEGVIAMASTKTRSIWPNIPKGPLLDALEGKNVKYARSDKEADAHSPTFRVTPDNYIETDIPL